jgi:hypothetical protein
MNSQNSDKWMKKIYHQIWTAYLWLKPLHKVKGLSASVWLKFLGENIMPDLAANPKALMANGLTHGLKSTPLGLEAPNIGLRN